MMELRIEPYDPAQVAFNKADVMAAVEAYAAQYKGLVVTDKAQAKRDRAEINKILVQIDDARKTVKKRYEAPLKAFEADVKDVIAPLKEVGAAIDAQIKVIEEQERQDKKTALLDAWNAQPRGVGFERVYDPAWLNASVSLKKATELMNEAEKRCVNDLNVIMGLGSPNQVALIDRYLEGADLADVLAYNKRLGDAQVFGITGAETVEDVAKALEAEDPRNEYVVTDRGIQVTAKPTPHTIQLTCTNAQLDEVCRLLDELGCFFILD